MKLLKTILFCSFTASTYAAAEGLTLGGTRLIYDATKKEANITLDNKGKSAPQLIQSWVSDINRKNNNIPFIVTPPVSKIAQNTTTSIRVVYTGTNTLLLTDRESQFLLNVRAVPATERSDNPQRLTIATQNIIKLIYRPAGLTAEGAARAGESVKVTSSQKAVYFENPTPYVVSLTGVTINGKKIDRPGTIQPYATHSVSLVSGTPTSVTWRTINDFGGMTKEISRKF